MIIRRMKVLYVKNLKWVSKRKEGNGGKLFNVKRLNFIYCKGLFNCFMEWLLSWKFSLVVVMTISLLFGVTHVESRKVKIISKIWSCYNNSRTIHVPEYDMRDPLSFYSFCTVVQSSLNISWLTGSYHVLLFGRITFRY